MAREIGNGVFIGHKSFIGQYASPSTFERKNDLKVSHVFQLTGEESSACGPQRRGDLLLKLTAGVLTNAVEKKIYSGAPPMYRSPAPKFALFCFGKGKGLLHEREPGKFRP